MSKRDSKTSELSQQDQSAFNLETPPPTPMGDRQLTKTSCPSGSQRRENNHWRKKQKRPISPMKKPGQSVPRFSSILVAQERGHILSDVSQPPQSVVPNRRKNFPGRLYVARQLERKGISPSTAKLSQDGQSTVV